MSSLDGTYGFVYSGIRGVGIGLFIIKGTNIIGTDYTGVRYTGTVSQNAATSTVQLLINATVPAGVYLVQGTSEQDMIYTLKGSHTLPNNFANGKPIEINQGQGPVTLMISRVPDEYSPFVNGFKFVPR